MDIEQQKLRALRARQLMEEPLIVEVFETIETQILEQWKSAPARDSEGREKLWMMMKLTDRLKLHFVSILESGQLADAQMLEQEKINAFKKIVNLINN